MQQKDRLEAHGKATADAKVLISKVCNVCAHCEQGAGKFLQREQEKQSDYFR